MLKRAFDLVVAVASIILLSPLFLLIACVIRWTMGTPILFKQLRPGKGSKPFIMLKFRTMLNERDPEGNILEDRLRLTSVGRFLRATSLDEIPELWNVIRGEMSIVGPRPLLMEYLQLYSFEQLRRHEVRPGVTGWAQVNGRNRIGWEQKFELDVWYVDNRSFLLDLRIIALTIVKVLVRQGISADGEATMTKFEGSHRK